MRRNVVRATVRASGSSCASGSVRQSSRAATSSSRIWSSSADVAVALVRRVQGEAERAERVLLAGEEHRHRHREVLVDACQRHRLGEHVRALRLRRLERRLAVGDAVRVAGEHVHDLRLVRPATRAVRSDDEKRLRLPAVRVVGGVEDLLGRHEVEEHRAGRSGSTPTCRRRRPPCRRSDRRAPKDRRCLRGR